MQMAKISVAVDALHKKVTICFVLIYVFMNVHVCMCVCLFLTIYKKNYLTIYYMMIHRQLISELLSHCT